MIISTVKTLMEERGWTTPKLRAATGMSFNTIAKARDERIVNCRFGVLVEIAQMLGCQAKDLFEEEPRKKLTNHIRPNITSNVSQLMESRGLTNLDITKQTGLSNATIVKAKDKRIVTCYFGTLEKLAEALDCQVKELFQEEGEK